MEKFSQERLRWRRSQGCADHACVEVAADHGWVYIRDSKRPEEGFLRFTKDEWRAFTDAVAGGEFRF